MNDYIKNIMDSLNENQKNAVTVEKNSVIAAGAGSGKTKVLAARYVYFVVEKGCQRRKNNSSNLYRKSRSRDAQKNL